MKTDQLENVVAEVTYKIIQHLHVVTPRGDKIKYLDSLIETCVQHRNRVTDEIAAARKKRAHDKAVAAKKAMLQQAGHVADEPTK
jgi:prephenate dehydratase